MTTDKATLHDPTAFAREAYSRLAGGIPGAADYAAAQEAALEAALDALRATLADAVESAMRAAVRRQVDDVSDAAYTYGTEAHAAGVAFGARAEALRRAIAAD